MAKMGARNCDGMGCLGQPSEKKPRLVLGAGNLSAWAAASAILSGNPPPAQI